MGTIETLNSNIIEKIKLLSASVAAIEAENIPVPSSIKQRIETTSSAYTMMSMGILNKYFLFLYTNKGQEHKKTYHDEKATFLREFHSLLRRERFSPKLDVIRGALCNLTAGKIHLDIANDSFRAMPSRRRKRSDGLDCEVCKQKMSVSPNMSQLLCVKCGMRTKLRGMIFKDDQFFYQEGRRSKHGNYDPNKHCRLWVDRIQARDLRVIPDDLIKQIRKLIRVDRIHDKMRITCELIRKYLRKTKYTKFNEHVPLIRKILTGVAPPQLTELEKRKINIYFSKIVVACSDIDPGRKTSTNYHPYIILKILEQIIPDRARCKKIISCIHLQARETLIEHDRKWRKICEYIPEFTYRPTSRHEYKDIG